MGPIYRTIFMDMAEAGEDLDEITAADLGTMLEAGLNGLYGIVDAKVGDKTLADTLAPSVDATESSRSRRKRFQRSTGRDEESCRSRTRFYQGHGSKIRDVPAVWARDPEACWMQEQTACCIILSAMADGISELLYKTGIREHITNPFIAWISRKSKKNKDKISGKEKSPGGFFMMK